jgi:hypothetical protein
LAQAGAHFDVITEGGLSDVVVDGTHSTHLSTSLKELESLNISAVELGGDGAIVDLGGNDIHGLVASLPTFEGGPVTLTLDDISELTSDTGVHGDTYLVDDIEAFAEHHVTNINLESLSSQDLVTNFTDVQALDAAIQSTNHYFALQPGAHTEHLTLTISDTQANDLAQAGAHFDVTSASDIIVHSHATHLSSTLKDLADLHVDKIDVSGGTIISGVEHVNIDLGNIDLSGGHAAVDSILASIPVFELDPNESRRSVTKLDVALNLTTQQTTDLAALEASSPQVTSELIEALTASGITSIDSSVDLVSTLSHSGDWLNLQLAGHIQHFGIAYQENLIGSNNPQAPLSLNQVFDHELASLVNSGELTQSQEISTHNALASIDLLSKFTSPDKFGDLIQALSASGVTDFVVQSGSVEISDALAAALVDAGMLQALPSANLVLDASAQVVDNYAYLETTLKAMSELGIDSIQVGIADQLYVKLGLPANDDHAMSDISNLLNALDPANHAKELAHNEHGDPVGIALVISGEIAATIQKSGGLTAADMQHLENLGINEIAIEGAHATTNGIINSAVVSQAHAPLPEVKLLGVSEDPIHDDMQHHNPAHIK